MKVVSLDAPRTVALAKTEARSAELATHRILAALPALALVSVLPAVFWPTMIYLAAGSFGYAPGATALVTMGFLIAFLLAVVCGAIMMSSED